MLVQITVTRNAAHLPRALPLWPPPFRYSKRDANGSTYLEAARGAGYGARSTAEMVAGARRTSADLAAFLELHIEQAGSGAGRPRAPPGHKRARRIPAGARRRGRLRGAASP